METRLLRPEEAAQFLGVSRSRVYEFIRRGDLESIKLGRSRRFDIQVLNEFVARIADHPDWAKGL